MRWLGEHDALALLEEHQTGHYDAILVGVPASLGTGADEPLAKLTSAGCPLVTFRDHLGQHASVGATAAAVAARAVLEGVLPFASAPMPLPHKRLLLLELGPRVAAMEVFA